MSIAEQMGTALERTAVSTNIKERRDFSCAIFGVRSPLDREMFCADALSNCDSLMETWLLMHHTCQSTWDQCQRQ